MTALSPAMSAELRRYPITGQARGSLREASARALVRRGLLSMREDHVTRIVLVHAGRPPDVTDFDPPRVVREFWLTQAGAAAARELAPEPTP